MPNQSPLIDDPAHDLVQSSILPLTNTAQRDLIRVLALSTHRKMDPAPFVHALSREYSGGNGRRLNKIAESIRQGVPVTEALLETPGLLEPHVVTALQLSAADGTLPEMYDALLKGNAGGSSALAQNTDPSELTRCFFTVCAFVLLLTFLMIFIVPTFSSLFDEFGLILPAPTRLLISASDVAAAYWFLPALLVLILVALRAPSIERILSNRLNPLASGFLPPSGPVAIRSVLGIAAQSNRPMVRQLKTIAETLRPNRFRRRLHRASERIEQGGEVWHSLAAERVISRREIGHWAWRSSIC